MEKTNESLLLRIEELEKKIVKKQPKDAWDKLSIVATFLSSVLLAGLVALFTIFYQTAEQKRLNQAQQLATENASIQNQISLEQNRLRHIEVVSKFIPYLSGNNATNDTQKLAIVALKQLGSAELAAEFALSIGGEGVRSGLEAILTNPSTTPNERSVIAPAYSRLLRHTITSVEEFIDDFRKNFDQTKRRDSLLKCVEDLKAVNEAAIKVQDISTATLSLITLGNTYRYMTKFDKAIITYQEAEKLAKQVHRKDLQFKALLGRGRAQLFGYGSVEEARKLAELAQSLASTSIEQFDAIDLIAEAEIKQGNFETAVKLLDKALSLPNISAVENFYGYLDRADAYYKLSMCEHVSEHAQCLHYLSKAELDYEKAREISESLGWSGLTKQVNGFMAVLKVQKRILENKILP